MKIHVIFIIFILFGAVLIMKLILLVLLSIIQMYFKASREFRNRLLSPQFAFV